MLECEANQFLAKPLKERQRTLLIYEEQSPKHVANLKKRMAEIHYSKKALQKGQLSL